MLLTLYACKQDPLTKFPDFTFRLPDSTATVSSQDIPSGMPIVLFIFKSTCEGCQETTDSLLKNIYAVRNVRFYFLSREALSDVILFRDHFKMASYPNIVVGQDYDKSLSLFFKNPHTPIIAIYNSSKELQGIYDRQPYVSELISKIQAIN